MNSSSFLTASQTAVAHAVPNYSHKNTPEVARAPRQDEEKSLFPTIST